MCERVNEATSLLIGPPARSGSHGKPMAAAHDRGPGRRGSWCSAPKPQPPSLPHPLPPLRPLLHFPFPPSAPPLFLSLPILLPSLPILLPFRLPPFLCLPSPHQAVLVASPLRLLLDSASMQSVALCRSLSLCVHPSEGRSHVQLVSLAPGGGTGQNEHYMPKICLGKRWSGRASRRRGYTCAVPHTEG